MEEVEDEEQVQGEAWVWAKVKSHHPGAGAYVWKEQEPSLHLHHKSMACLSLLLHTSWPCHLLCHLLDTSCYLQ